MTQENKYNGWTNYATWRVALEIFDPFDMSDYYQTYMLKTYEFGQFLKEYADDIVFMNIPPNNNSLAIDYAGAFLQEVNWYEIADHIIQDYEYELKASDENTREDYDETV
jgi:hypothetical protein